MKLKLWSALLLPVILMTGCVKTVSDQKTGGVPFVKDRIEGRYERSVEEVYNAAKYVLQQNGTLQEEMIIHQEDATVRAMDGRVNQRKIFIRVEPVDATVTSVVVQARTSGGGTDMNLAYELEKQIALRLVGS